jgi:hypothetical protein
VLGLGETPETAISASAAASRVVRVIDLVGRTASSFPLAVAIWARAARWFRTPLPPSPAPVRSGHDLAHKGGRGGVT